MATRGGESELCNCIETLIALCLSRSTRRLRIFLSTGSPLRRFTCLYRFFVIIGIILVVYTVHRRYATRVGRVQWITQYILLAAMLVPLAWHLLIVFLPALVYMIDCIQLKSLSPLRQTSGGPLALARLRLLFWTTILEAITRVPIIVQRNLVQALAWPLIALLVPTREKAGLVLIISQRVLLLVARRLQPRVFELRIKAKLWKRYFQVYENLTYEEKNAFHNVNL